MFGQIAEVSFSTNKSPNSGHGFAPANPVEPDFQSLLSRNRGLLGGFISFLLILTPWIYSFGRLTMRSR